MRYPHLTTPITLGDLELVNRMVMSPLTTYGMANPDGSTNARHLAYYEARAKGGYSLIRVEAAMVHLSGKCWLNQLAAHEDRYIPSLTRIVRSIKRHGPRVMLQLHHGGRTAVPALSGEQTIAPSTLRMPGREDLPREMTLEDIELQIEAWGQAARRAREAGFDGVELHMGTSYLLLSFISPAQNVREDEYGRDFDGRIRFPLRIVQRIRELAGSDFPIGARIASSDYYDGGVDIANCQRVAQTLESAGLAYLDVSAGQGPNAVRESTLAMGYGEGVLRDAAGAVKSVVQIPVMTVGRYYSLASAEEVLAAGQADMIVFGRATIADPAIVAKSLRGDEARVIPCIGCQGCHGGASRALGASCMLNPETGHEFELRIEPVAIRRRILVRGAGVPGLELARVLTLRGHEVAISTDGLPFGGLLTLRSRVPGAEEVARGAEYFRVALAELGVRIIDDISDGGFDFTVDTRPGEPIIPEISGLDLRKASLGEDVLDGKITLASLGRRVAVIGPGIFAGETALYLAGEGRDVTLVASGERAMQDANPLVAGKTTLRFSERGGTIVTGAECVGVNDGTLEVQIGSDRRELGLFDSFVLALGWTPPPAPQQAEGEPLGDTWDAFACLQRVFAATKLARSLV